MDIMQGSNMVDMGLPFCGLGRAILNSLQMYSLTRGVSVTTWLLVPILRSDFDWRYLSMFSIYCRRLEVIMPPLDLQCTKSTRSQ